MVVGSVVMIVASQSVREKINDSVPLDDEVVGLTLAMLLQRQFGSFNSRPKNEVCYGGGFDGEQRSHGKTLLHHNNLIKMIICDDQGRFSKVYKEQNWVSIDHRSSSDRFG